MTSIDPMPPPLPSRSLADAALGLPRWAWSLAGASIGLLDFSVLLLLDANMMVAGRDATLLVMLMFLIPYGLLGWAVGGLADARRQAELDRRTIEDQLVELERTQRALVQEEKLAGIGRLAAGVAHEVRNPLGVIRASASMVQESFESNSDPYRALGFVCEETDRLDRLIQSLLTFAKPQPIEARLLDVSKVVDLALELARNEAREQNVELDVSIAPDLPPIHADADRLSQTLYGLVLNALQALSSESPTARRRISVEAGYRDDLVRIDIADTGPGIAQELRDQIFEPFVTTKDTGTGLGLPMALSMVEAQGGALRLVASESSDPTEPSGARFRLEFPVADSEGRLAS